MVLVQGAGSWEDSAANGRCSVHCWSAAEEDIIATFEARVDVAARVVLAFVVEIAAGFDGPEHEIGAATEVALVVAGIFPSGKFSLARTPRNLVAATSYAMAASSAVSKVPSQTRAAFFGSRISAAHLPQGRCRTPRYLCFLTLTVPPPLTIPVSLLPPATPATSSLLTFPGPSSASSSPLRPPRI